MARRHPSSGRELETCRYRIDLDREIRELIPPGLAELTTGEAAPVLGARLLTRTRLADDFPSLRFCLATTRATNAC